MIILCPFNIFVLLAFGYTISLPTMLLKAGVCVDFN